VCVGVCVYMYVCICMCVCVPVFICVFVSARVFVRVLFCVCLCVFAGVFVGVGAVISYQVFNLLINLWNDPFQLLTVAPDQLVGSGGVGPLRATDASSNYV